MGFGFPFVSLINEKWYKNIKLTQFVSMYLKKQKVKDKSVLELVQIVQKLL